MPTVTIDENDAKVMETLYDNLYPMSISKIAEALNMDIGLVDQTVQELAAVGLLQPVGSDWFFTERGNVYMFKYKVDKDIKALREKTGEIT
jgi:predicted transcriptional regulator